MDEKRRAELQEWAFQEKQRKLQDSNEKRDRTIEWVQSHNGQVVSPQRATELDKAWKEAFETNRRESEAICKEFDELSLRIMLS